MMDLLQLCADTHSSWAMILAWLRGWLWKTGSASNEGTPLWSNILYRSQTLKPIDIDVIRTYWYEFAIPKVKTSMNLTFARCLKQRAAPGLEVQQRRFLAAWVLYFFELDLCKWNLLESWMITACNLHISPIELYSRLNWKGRPPNSFDSVWPICIPVSTWKLFLWLKSLVVAEPLL